MNPYEKYLYIAGICAICAVVAVHIAFHIPILIERIRLRSLARRIAQSMALHPEVLRGGMKGGEMAEKLANTIFMQTHRVFMSPIGPDGEADSTCILCALCSHKMNKREPTEFQTLQPDTQFRCTGCGYELERNPDVMPEEVAS